MNILYLSDPTCCHDTKWITFFSKIPGWNVYLLYRKRHEQAYLEKRKKEKTNPFQNCTILGAIDDFSFSQPFQTLKIIRFIKKFIQKNDINLFHITYGEPNALWGSFRGAFNVPVFLTTRGSDLFVGISSFLKEKTLLKKLMVQKYRKAFKMVDVIISTSIAQKVFIEENFQIKEQVHVIRTGVDVEDILNSKGKIHENLKNKKYILFPRYMRPVYNHEFGIAAIRKLSKEISENYTFVFIDRDSSDQDYVHKIKALINENSEIKFEFLNNLPVTDMHQLMKEAQLVVMTPTSDGSPVSAMETMLFETPLLLPPLAYDVQLFGEVDRFKVWQTEDLAQSIQRLLENLETSKLKREGLKKKVIAHANRKIEMGKLEALYKKWV